MRHRLPSVMFPSGRSQFKSLQAVIIIARYSIPVLFDAGETIATANWVTRTRTRLAITKYLLPPATLSLADLRFRSRQAVLIRARYSIPVLFDAGVNPAMVSSDTAISTKSATTKHPCPPVMFPLVQQRFR